MDRVLFFVLVLAGVSARGNDLLQVPSPVMDFILGCERNLRAPKIPVARTEVDPATGAETEEVKLMDLGRLRDALGKSFESGSMVEHIITEIENSLTEQQTKAGRQACTQLTVSVPPQEVKDLSGQLQAVVKQNNQQLLSQINTLFSFKLKNLFADIELAIAANAVPVKEQIVNPPEVIAPADEAMKIEKIKVVVRDDAKAVASEDATVVAKATQKIVDKDVKITAEDAPVKPIVAEITVAEKLTPLKEEASEIQDAETPTVSQESVIPKRRVAIKRRVPNIRAAPEPVVEEPIPDQPVAEIKPTVKIADARKRRLNDMMALRRQFLSRRRGSQ